MSYSDRCGADGGGCLAGTVSTGAAGTTNAWAAAVLSDVSFDWNSYGQKTYLYRKSRKNFVYDWGNRNVKNFRWWGVSNGGINQYPDFFFGLSNGRIGIEGIPTPYQDYNMSSSNLAKAEGPVNEWFTEEMVFKSNTTTDAADAVFAFSVNGGAELVRFPNTTWMTNTLKLKTETGYSNDGRMRRLYAVHLVIEGSDGWTPAPAGSQYWADDVYVDTTWARVVVADAPVLEDSKYREIQIPSEWASDSIVVTVNTRAFPAGSKHYLFVVDADGKSSPGFLIDQNLPKPPANLVVN